MINSMALERRVADEILALEAEPEGTDKPLLLLVTKRGIVRKTLETGAKFPNERETWMDELGQAWRCQVAFTVTDSKVNAERETRWMARVRAGAPGKEMTQSAEA